MWAGFNCWTSFVHECFFVFLRPTKHNTNTHEASLIPSSNSVCLSSELSNYHHLDAGRPFFILLKLICIPQSSVVMCLQERECADTYRVEVCSTSRRPRPWAGQDKGTEGGWGHWCGLLRSEWRSPWLYMATDSKPASRLAEQNILESQSLYQQQQQQSKI